MQASLHSTSPVTVNARRSFGILSLLLFVAVFGIGNYILDLSDNQVHWWADTGWTLASLLATWKCWSVSHGAQGQYRIAWRMFASANFAWFLGILYWDIQELVLGKVTPFPALSDLGFLALSFFYAAAFYFFYRPLRQRSFTLLQFSKFGILFSGVAISQVVIFFDAISQGDKDLLYVLVALAYPVSHISMLLYNLSHFLAAGTSRISWVMGLALVSAAVHTLAVILYAYALLGNTYQVGDYLDIYWIVAFGLMYLSANEQEFAVAAQKQPGKPNENLAHSRSHDVALSAFVMISVAMIFLLFAKEITPASLRWLTPLLIFMITFVSLREWATLHLERKLRETIHQSEQQLRSIAMISPVGVFRTDANGCCIYANEKWHEITGVRNLQSGSLEWLDFVYKDDQERVRQAWNEIQNHSNGLSIEFRLANTLPEIRWVLCQIVAEPGIGTNKTGYVGSLTDITVQKNTQLALGKSKAEFESMFNSISDAVIYTNDHRQILLINPSAAMMFGYSVNELAGRTTRQLYANRDDFDNTGISIFNQDSRGDTYEMLYRRKDGSEFWGETIGTPVRDAKNNLLGYVGIIRDITERKKNEAALSAVHEELEERIRDRTFELDKARIEAEKANAAKTEFLSRMSHELRTPMNAILGFAQLLDSDREGMSGSHVDSVHEILEAGYHLLDLINDMLDLSKIESGRLNLDIRPVMLEPLVQECVQFVINEASKRSVSINVNIESLDRKYVLADPLRLKQVLLNLLSNAIKYNRNGGSVHIIAKYRNGRIYVSIQDTGVGIPQEYFSDIFQPFTRLDSENNGIEGTGIGLTIAQKMLNMMRGSIKVESTVPEGSEFTIDLPACAADDLPIPEKKISAASSSICTSKKSILYIEDNYSNRALIRAMLARDHNIHFRETESAEHGLRLVQEQKPDLILLDIHMAGMNGFEMFEVLQLDPDTRDIPVIAMSGNALPADIEKGLRAGFVDYITKPIDIGKFKDILRKILQD